MLININKRKSTERLVIAAAVHLMKKLRKKFQRAEKS